MPYYLHLLDKVQGAAHFDVPEERARELIAETGALCRATWYRNWWETAGAPSKYPGGVNWGSEEARQHGRAAQ